MAFRLEQAGYPYVPGSHGIPFGELSLGRRLITGGSGQQLYCEASIGFLWVFDVKDPRFILKARSKRGEFYFNVNTRSQNPGAKGEKHRDLFGGSFVDFALLNFAAQERYPQIVVGEWDTSSVNFAQYHEALDSTGDRVAAAMSTWTGKTVRRHGFEARRNSSIVTDEPDRVCVVFSR